MSYIPWLDKQQLHFPPPDQALATPNGLLAAGGDLSPARLLNAYRQGIFPWYEEGQPLLWWSPSPRSVLFPARLHISRSLRKTLRRGLFTVTADTAFKQVIRACAARRHYAEGTWITRDMQQAYTELFKRGYAHSIEAWQGGELVGGLYGVALGSVFFGESMFSLRTDASKVAFVHLVKQLEQWNFRLIDCQVTSRHLLSLGAEEISRAHFQQILINCIDKEPENCKDSKVKESKDTTDANPSWQITWCFGNE